MKKLAMILFLTTILLILPSKVHAAWVTSGNNDYKLNGNVGIGISNPVDPLHINFKPSGNTFESNWGKAYIGEGTGSWWISGTKGRADGNGYNNIVSNGYFNNGWFRREANKESWFLSNHVTGNNSGYFALFHSEGQNQSNITNLKTFLRIDSNGNTIIEGRLTAKEIRVKSNVWADYVFDDSYDLKNLTELEDFIIKNKHLPGMPKANQVLAEGIEVSEMLRLQMEKIEELTLYTIKLQKQIDALM